MDLSSLKVSQKDFLMEVRHPATREIVKCEDGSVMTIGILSADTPAAKSALVEFKREVRALGAEVTDRGIYLARCNLIASATTSCNIEFGGKMIEHSKEAIAELLSDESFTWLGDDIIANADHRANFMQA